MNSRISLLGAAALYGCMTAAYATALPQSDLLNALESHTGAPVQLQTSQKSAYVLLRTANQKPLLADNVSLSAPVRALNFLQTYGPILGVTTAQNQLQLQRVSTDRAGNQHVHLDQMQSGLPVFGARLVVHMNDAGITGVSGVFVPNLELQSTQAAQTEAALQATAMRMGSKQHPNATLAIQSARLMFYREGLLEGFAGDTRLAYEVMLISQAGDVRERIILDANNGRVLNQINEIHSLKNREIYTPDQTVPPVITEGAVNAPADPALTGDVNSDPTTRAPRPATDNLYIFAGGTYDLYANLFGREGYDDGSLPAEEQVQKSVYLINDACPNAYWNGDSTNYCPGFDADDVVSHEWSHGYTEYTHGLIYQYQSGALNEAYSDIFGEMYDLVNGLEGPLGVTLTEGDYFENGGSRWVVGEDLSEPAAAVLLRDMWDPDAFGLNASAIGFQVLNFGYPGSVITSNNYFCGSSDGGGVHTNSGVPNHAFAMLVDGKEFNGVTIPAIGMTRAAHIYFQAMTHYQVPSTNFAQHADALAQSCADLTGLPLNDVLGNPSSDVITAETCAAVEAAMEAVEMRLDPTEKCGYQPLLQAEESTPALCGNGLFATPSFSENWDTATDIPAGWTSSENITGDTWEGTTWELASELPSGREGQAMFVANTFGGSCAPGGDISASFRLDTPVIEVTQADSILSISHLMQSEFAYDGGNLKVSINNGEFSVVPNEAFRHNAYNTTLETGAGAIPDPAGVISGGNTSPIAGEDAWSGSDEGKSSSDWGTSQIDLTALGVQVGDSVQFRFEFGQDGCNGNLGWYVDKVEITYCSTDAPSTGTELDITPPATVTPSATNSRGGALGLWMLVPMFLLLGLRRKA